MSSSSGTASWAMAEIRSAMAADSSISEPVGMETLTETWPWSMSGISTMVVAKTGTAKRTTSATEASIPALRWWTK